MTIVLQQIHHINQVYILAWSALHGKELLGEEKKSCLINVNKILTPSDARKKRKASNSNTAGLPSMNADELSIKK